MLDIRKPCMVMTNRICLKPLNSSRNKDTSTNFKFPIWKCLPNTLWSFRLSTRLGKVSRILFEKAAYHRILTMLAELWSEFRSHYQFFTKYDEVFQAFNKIGKGHWCQFCFSKNCQLNAENRQNSREYQKLV